MQFCDRPESFRQSIRRIVSDFRGEVDGYCGLGIQLILPRDGWRDLLTALQSAGGRERVDARVYYPAETCAPEYLCHGRNGNPPEPSCGRYLLTIVDFAA